MESPRMNNDQLGVLFSVIHIADEDKPYVAPGFWKRLFGNKNVMREAHDKERSRREKRDLTGLAGLALVFPFLARAVASRATNSETEKRQAVMRRAALARRPIVSLDEDLDDVRLENKEQDLGKIAGDSAFGTLLSESVKLPFRAADKLGFGRTDRSITFPAAALLLLTGVGGVSLMAADKMADKSRGASLDKEIADQKNLLDAEQFGLLQQNRTFKNAEEELEMITKTAGLLTAMGQLLPVAALVLLFGGYKVGEHIEDQTNEKREAYDKLIRQLDQTTKSGKIPELSMSTGTQKLFGSRGPKQPRPEEFRTGALSVV